MNQNLSPPKNANARQRTGRARKTKLRHGRLNTAFTPVKSAVVDFVQQPTFARFRCAFPFLFPPEGTGIPSEPKPKI